MPTMSFKPLQRLAYPRSFKTWLNGRKTTPKGVGVRLVAYLGAHGAPFGSGSTRYASRATCRRLGPSGDDPIARILTAFG